MAAFTISKSLFQQSACPWEPWVLGEVLGSEDLFVRIFDFACQHPQLINRSQGPEWILYIVRSTRGRVCPLWPWPHHSDTLASGFILLPIRLWDLARKEARENKTPWRTRGGGGGGEHQHVHAVSENEKSKRFVTFVYLSFWFCNLLSDWKRIWDWNLFIYMYAFFLVFFINGRCLFL